MSDAVALADLDRAIAAAQIVVSGITASQWDWPTPCTGLDVSTLVNHLVSGNLLFATVVSAV
jgi:Mycothiol maleylpyruvate isomerase N-terminal domain